MSDHQPIQRAGITEVPGLRVGHFERRTPGWRTGTTVLLADGGAVASGEARGGGPGTRETDLLEPEAMIERIDAIWLTGGSAYGLAAADGVMAALAERGQGFRVGPNTEQVVPIVPTAVIFDLGRGGRFDRRPDADFGRRAVQRARRGPVVTGAVGAGTGAQAGWLQGGVGTARTELADGTVVAALVVVNAAGRVIDPSTGLPWFHTGSGLRRPPASERRALAAYIDSCIAEALPPPASAPAERHRGGSPPLNTTIGVVACSARLTKAECHKLAQVAHDGLARAVRPVHSMFDGDTIFALSTAVGELAVPPLPEHLRSRSRAVALNTVLDAGADCFAAACTVGVVDARSGGAALAYRDLCPGAFGQR
jgi:L-aminopeptidase/D-esterase-like protein